MKRKIIIVVLDFFLAAVNMYFAINGTLCPTLNASLAVGLAFVAGYAFYEVSP